MKSLVTVCITTFNRVKLLPCTVESVLNQTYKNIEVIIVDDCSTDNTRGLIENEILPSDNRTRASRVARSAESEARSQKQRA